MKQVDIDEAQAGLPRLVEDASRGQPFVITKGGRPVVKVVAVDAPPAPVGKRFGFLRDIKVPDDFDTMGAEEIRRMFEGPKTP